MGLFNNLQKTYYLSIDKDRVTFTLYCLYSETTSQIK